MKKFWLSLVKHMLFLSIFVTIMVVIQLKTDTLMNPFVEFIKGVIVGMIISHNYNYELIEEMEGEL